MKNVYQSILFSSVCNLCSSLIAGNHITQSQREGNINALHTALFLPEKTIKYIFVSKTAIAALKMQKTFFL
jgi:hypothetical protein